MAVELFLVRSNEGREGLGNLFRRLDVLGEGYRPAHRRCIHLKAILLALQLARALGQSIPRTDHRGCRGEVDLLAGCRCHGIGGDVLIHCHDQNLVVRQQALFYRFAEAETVEFRAVDSLVIHGSQLRGAIGGFALDRIVKESGSGCHVQALARLDVLVIMNFDEVGRVLAGECHTGGAVRLVANNQIKRLEAFLLRFVDRRKGLVGRKHHMQALGALAAGKRGGNHLSVCGDRYFEVVRSDILSGLACPIV